VPGLRTVVAKMPRTFTNDCILPGLAAAGGVVLGTGWCTLPHRVVTSLISTPTIQYGTPLTMISAGLYHQKL